LLGHQCQLSRQVKQWHTKTRWKAVLSSTWLRRSRSDLHHLNFSCTSMPEYRYKLVWRMYLYRQVHTSTY
jgi:endonuclease I